MGIIAVVILLGIKFNFKTDDEESSSLTHDSRNILDNVSPLEKGEQSVCIIEDGTKEIKNNTFRGCVHIKEIKLPKSLTKIGKDAFINCDSLEIINFPNSLYDIVDNPFIGIPKLHITFDNNTDNNGFFKIVDNYLINMNNKTIVAYLGNDSIINTIPNDIQIVGKQAFSHKKTIKQIDFSKSNITEIQTFAFEDCTNLKSIDLPLSLCKVGVNPFKGVHSVNDCKFKNDYFVLDKGLFVDVKSRLLIAYLSKTDKIGVILSISRETFPSPSG
jgi:hypothetical protein